MTFEWDNEDRWRSNFGAGPLIARVLCATNKVVKLERWNERGSRITRFELPLEFFLSERCGWRLVEQTNLLPVETGNQ